MPMVFSNDYFLPGSKQTSTAVVFTLALFSYTLNHLCEKLNNAIYRKIYPDQTTATFTKGMYFDILFSLTDFEIS